MRRECLWVSSASKRDGSGAGIGELQSTGEGERVLVDRLVCFLKGWQVRRGTQGNLQFSS